MRWSSNFPSERNSLARKEPELGDSAGERRRIDMVNGNSEVVSEKSWGMGFRVDDGMECDIVGESAVGGS